jgi:glycosyltransferase involved in cell wall biosynthesis
MIASSRGYETFGMSVIESFSKGIPVLARHHGSYLELVQGSGAGATFADADELEVEMRRMLADAAGLDAMRARAYQLFQSMYSEEAVLPQYLGLVDRLSSERSSTALPVPSPEPVTV